MVPHPGVPLTFTDVHQLRLTNLCDANIAFLEALDRDRGQCEPVSRDFKVTGLPHVPLALRQAWLTTVLMA
jgi:hypothetical protein